MTVQKIKSSRIPTVTSTNYVGEAGMIFYEATLGDLRLGDGYTPGGTLITTGGSGYILPPATTSTLGGIIVGTNLTITPSGVLSAMIGDIDGGVPSSIYTSLPIIDGGGI